MGRRTPAEKKCVECGGAARPIRLIDKGEAGSHHDVEYAARDAGQGFWTWRYPVAGRVAAWLCPDCGRIALYAEPRDEDD